MKGAFLTALVASLMTVGCIEPDPSNTEKRVAKGDREYGGVFKLNERDAFQTLLPYAIIDAVSNRIAGQIYEGLIKLNAKDLSIEPRIATSWEVGAEGKVYTFHLKKGVMFHDDSCFPDGKGREVKAADFKYSFELLCTKLIQDTIPNLVFERTFKDKVVGANEFYEDKSGEIAGVKVVDDYTLEITLIRRSSSFIYIMAYPAASVVPREAVEMYGANLIVGSGPFMFGKFLEDNDERTEKLVLLRNPNYHEVDSFGNQLPYLDSVLISFNNSQHEELALFRARELDMILGLPAEEVSKIVQEHRNKVPKPYILERSAEMSTQFYEFNLSNPLFGPDAKGLKVRQAISYAIDREKLIGKVLSGERGIHGITPPSFREYKDSKIQGYSYDPEKAKKLLEAAGYPDGENFPTITLKLNSGGLRNTDVAFEVQDQLRNVLNINLDLEIVSMSKLLDDRKYARGDMFRSGWIADYPSPENFLVLMYGKNVPEDTKEPSILNTTRYRNEAFDELFMQGVTGDSLRQRYDAFEAAEQMMMNDAPLVILWYDERFRLIQSNVQNFSINAMDHRDYSEVYIQDPKVEQNTKGAGGS